MTLSSLIARVEGLDASGPFDILREKHREINEAVADAVGIKGTVKVGHEILGNLRTVPARLLDYVNSVDAALTLVPEGWKLRQMNFSAPCADDRKWHLNLHGGREGEDTFVGRGATPAIALTAACLRARDRISTAPATNRKGEGL